MKKSLVIAILFLCAAFTVVQAQNTALRIDPGSGNVSVGQSTADEKLVVNGNIKAVGEIKTNARVKDKTGFVMPVGTVLSYAGSAVPEGWILCDGRALDRNDPQYAELFTAIGTGWGAPDANSFNVPDLRGMFLRGVAGDATTDPEKETRVASNPGGNTGNAVGTKQTDAFQGHRHAEQYYNNEGGTNAHLWGVTSVSGPITSTNCILDPITDSTNGEPRTASDTRPVNAYVTYIIKY